MMPVFNDVSAIGQLLERIDVVLGEHNLRARVLLVDDASVVPLECELALTQYQAIEGVQILSLRRNLGHQRAIAIGLAYLEQHIAFKAVVIMDGDGEDAPEDIPRLCQKLNEEGSRCVVFAARMRRSESWLFLAFYHSYRLVHFLLTGVHVRVGNFSIVPFAMVRRLVVVSELWNHYAAAVFRSRISYTTIPTRRAPRLAGRSKMNFVSLIVHGLSAISVFGEYVGVRLLLVSMLLTTIVCALTFWLFVDPAARHVPQFSGVTTWAALLAILLMQGILGATALVVIALNSRSNANFIPTRDYVYFVDACKTVYAREQDRTDITPAMVDRDGGNGRRV
jgi:hypothetical protein